MAAAEPLEVDDAIALTDAELEERLQNQLTDVHNRLLDAVTDEDAQNEAGNATFDLMLLVDELVERFAPHMALMAIERAYDSSQRSEPFASQDRDDDLEWLRQREAARMIRQALEGD